MTMGGWRMEGVHQGIWLLPRRAGARPEVSQGSDTLRGEAAASRVDEWFPGGWDTSLGAATLSNIGKALHVEVPWGHDEDARRRLKEVVRQALRDGRLVAVRVPVSAPGGSIGNPVEEPASAPPREREDEQELTNPRWSVPRVEVGTELFAVVTYRDIKAPVDATLVISELDGGRAKKTVARVHTTVPTGSGDLKVTWKRNPEDAQADLKEDEAAGDSGPLEYRFTIESRDPECTEESGPLWLTNTITVNLVQEANREKHEKPKVVVLKDAVDGELRAKSEDGSATFEKVLVGPMEIRLAEPRFTDLAWSLPKVPVGEPVDAVFSYDDAIKGLTVYVVVYEFNHDGSSEEIKRLKVELAAVSGEAKVSFTRTEDEAQQDIAHDEHEGDTGPLEYRYRVMAPGDPESDASEPLWLTHTVSVKLKNKADGTPFPDGRELVLVAADGVEHRASLSGGQVSFEDVVCGPMTVKLAPKIEKSATS